LDTETITKEHEELERRGPEEVNINAKKKKKKTSPQNTYTRTNNFYNPCQCVLGNTEWLPRRLFVLRRHDRQRLKPS